MSLFGSLFGGGGTTVQQQAANNTNVDVGVTIENIMDMTGITKVLEWFGVRQVEIQQQQIASAEQGSMNAQELLDYLKMTQAEQIKQKQQVIDGVLPWAKGVAAAAMLALGVYAYRKWKGKK